LIHLHSKVGRVFIGSSAVEICPFLSTGEFAHWLNMTLDSPEARL
jgi:hypothetical protein